MKNFLKWYFKESWIHIIWILVLIGIVAHWSPGQDKNIALVFLSIVFAVLTLGKYRYWFKNLRK